MPEEIRENLFRLEIPLPDNPLKYVNSYVIKDGDGCLIVDVGLNRDECYQAMMDGLTALNVDLNKARFFITHLHADHFGLVSRLASDPGRILFSRPETEIIESWSGWEPMIAYAARNGFPEDQLRAALDSHPGFKYGSKWIPDLRRIEDGETLQVGGYEFTCLWTPGHSKGHFCLYEPREKILLSGDHILGDITPNIQCWSDEDNNLRDYLRSLDKTSALEADLVLPGHRTLIHDMLGRIAELKGHHQKRLDEVLAILQESPGTAFDTASRMSWDLSGEWADFPLTQKWFATAEATAHLRYLEDEGLIGRDEKGARIIYRPA